MLNIGEKNICITYLPKMWYLFAMLIFQCFQHITCATVIIKYCRQHSVDSTVIIAQCFQHIAFSTVLKSQWLQLVCTYTAKILAQPEKIAQIYLQYLHVFPSLANPFLPFLIEYLFVSHLLGSSIDQFKIFCQARILNMSVNNLHMALMIAKNVVIFSELIKLPWSDQLVDAWLKESVHV